MVSIPDQEPTLRDLATQLSNLVAKVDDLGGQVNHLATQLGQVQGWQEQTTHELAEIKLGYGVITGELAQMKGQSALMSEELAQTQKWNDRTWDVIKWVGGISAGLAVSASIALVGIVLKSALLG